MTLGWIYDPRFLQHDTGRSHIESPRRLEVIVRALQSEGLLDQMLELPFRQATPEQLALVHEPAYVDLVRLMCDEGFTFIGAQDTCIGRWSFDVAALAAGGVLAACDAVMAGTVARAFCAVRPPGHHAEVDQAMGFCLFNNVAVGAEHLVRHHGLTRVAIVDFDVHHGNGTQHAFQSRNDVLYISLHERPESLQFPGSGAAVETGSGPGEGLTRNVPLDRGSGRDEYRSAMEQQVLPDLDEYRPQFLLLSAGFDALMWDDISHVSLEPSDFAWITDALVQAAQRHAGGRVVSVLEGGYDLPNLGAAVSQHVRSLMREDLSSDMFDA
jgi:acetoin utilization deacetylase AcuC-like enzyme